MTISTEAVSQIADSLSIVADDSQVGAWVDHLDLLLRWNKVFNLTAITNPSDVLSQHLSDSLSVAPYVHGETVFDIGTGGGFPGIPLAILFPEAQFTLVDTVQKKTRFLKQVVGELKLSNVQVVNARVESLTPDSKANQVISRAFSSLEDFLQLTSGLASHQTEWLAMKGKLPSQELKALPNEFTYTVVPLTVPGLDAERHLIRIRKTL